MTRLGDENDAEALCAARLIAATATRAGVALSDLRFERDDRRLQQEQLVRGLQAFKGPSRRHLDRLEGQVATLQAEVSGLKSKLRAEREEKAKLKKAAADRRRRMATMKNQNKGALSGPQANDNG